MRCHHLVVAALACVAMLGVHEAAAGSHPARITSLAGVPYRKVYLPGTNALQEVCRLGQSGVPVGAVGDQSNGGTIFFGEGDTYWTYLELRPDSCAGCDAFYQATLDMAHLALYFPFAPETLSVNVSVVGSVPIPCHYPNFSDPNAIICDSFGATLNCQDSLTTIDFAIGIPPGCGITALSQPNGQVVGTAFLGFEFTTASDTTALNKPQIAVQASAKACVSFNPVGFIPYDFVSEYTVGNPVMYAEVLRCDNVAVRRSTWGRLKMQYR